LIFFFAVSLGWIAFAAGSVLAGASKRRDPVPSDQSPADASLTALVMPIYNEDPTRTAAGLQAMGEALLKIDAQRGFEIVVLFRLHQRRCMDQRDDQRRQVARSLSAIMPVWYRRRCWLNIARKSATSRLRSRVGAGATITLIVLDADSLIDAPTLKRLVQAMRGRSKVGDFCKTAPQLIGAKNFFCRFAAIRACVYGPVITRGLSPGRATAAITGDTTPSFASRQFAQYLRPAQTQRPQALRWFPSYPMISSKRPSCAAAAGRFAWPPIAAALGRISPTLIDIAVRDRRWAQGNLQHTKSSARRA